MPAPLMVPLTPGITVESGYTIRLTALDPTSGAVVSGVNISQSAILATNLTSGPSQQLQSGPYVLVPGPDSGDTAAAPSTGGTV